jgi:hypothetical protein
LRVTCVVCGAVRFDFDTEDFFAGLPIAGAAINAPAAKQLIKTKPLVFMLFLLFMISLCYAFAHGPANILLVARHTFQVWPVCLWLSGLSEFAILSLH